jgi:invasion associated locus B (IalB) protein
MHIRGRWRLGLLLFVAAAYAVPALAQQPAASDQAQPADAAPALKKPPKKKPPAAAASNQAAPADAAPAAKKPPKKKPPAAAAADQAAPADAATAAKKPPKKKLPASASDPTAAIAGGAKPTLLGQYGDWGAYAASPGGKKVCFAIATPASSETNPPGKSRNPSYMFISSRPAEKVSNEVSIIIGYPFKPSTDATVEVGSSSFALYTEQDGAWIKNAAEESRLIEAMRAGQNAVIKGTSAKGTRSTDIFSLKGLTQALDRSDQDCK